MLIYYKVKTYPLYIKDHFIISLFNFFYTRFLYLFNNIIYIFTKDFKSLDSIVNYLKT